MPQPPELQQSVTTRDRTRRGTKSVESNYRRMSRNIGKALRTATVGLGALGTAGIFAGINIAQSLTQTVRELDRVSKSTNIGISTLDAYRRIAKRTGVEFSDLTDVFITLSERIGEAARDPEGQIAKTFEELNLPIKELQSLEPDKQFLAISNALQETESQYLRNAFAAELFGDAFRNIEPVLNIDVSGLEAQVEVLSNAADAIDEQDVETVNRLAAAWAEVELAFQDVALAFLEEFDDELIQVAEWAENTLLPWIRDVAIPKIEEVVDDPNLIIETLLDFVLDIDSETLDEAIKVLIARTSQAILGAGIGIAIGRRLGGPFGVFGRVVGALAGGAFLSGFNDNFLGFIDEQVEGLADDLGVGIEAFGAATVLALSTALGLAALVSLPGRGGGIPTSALKSRLSSIFRPVGGALGALFSAAFILGLIEAVTSALSEDTSASTGMNTGVVGFIQRLRTNLGGFVGTVFTGAAIGLLFGGYGALIGALIGAAIGSGLLEDFIQYWTDNVTRIADTFANEGIVAGLTASASQLHKIVLGATFGSLIGFALFGPIGAVIGGIIGAALGPPIIDAIGGALASIDWNAVLNSVLINPLNNHVIPAVNDLIDVYNEWVAGPINGFITAYNDSPLSLINIPTLPTFDHISTITPLRTNAQVREAARSQADNIGIWGIDPSGTYGSYAQAVEAGSRGHFIPAGTSPGLPFSYDPSIGAFGGFRRTGFQEVGPAQFLQYYGARGTGSPYHVGPESLQTRRDQGAVARLLEAFEREGIGNVTVNIDGSVYGVEEFKSVVADAVNEGRRSGRIDR